MSPRVWYASFGSNLSYDRFLVYLNGGQAPGSSRISPGARDSTPPPRSRTMFTPRRLGFAGVAAGWSNGGVAFLDTEPSKAETALRLYDLTLEQFEDVFRQENGLDSPLVVDLDEVVAATVLDLSDRWYGRIVHLGDLDEMPILTFTAAERPETNVPHPAYVQTIVRGLETEVDGHGFGFSDRADVRRYLAGARGMHDFGDEDWDQVV